MFTRIRHRLPAQTRGYLNALVVSDDLFFQEIESNTFEPLEGQGARTRFYTASRLGALKSWERSNLWGEMTVYHRY